jgi:hypothetical protein
MQGKDDPGRIGTARKMPFLITGATASFPGSVSRCNPIFAPFSYALCDAINLAYELENRQGFNDMAAWYMEPAFPSLRTPFQTLQISAGLWPS